MNMLFNNMTNLIKFDISIQLRAFALLQENMKIMSMNVVILQPYPD